MSSGNGDGPGSSGSGRNATIVVATIGAISAVVVALVQAWDRPPAPQPAAPLPAVSSTFTGTPAPTPTGTPSARAVTLTVTGPNTEVSTPMAAVVNRAPPGGRTYWVLVHLLRDDGGSEFYAKGQLPSAPGSTQPFDVTFEDPGVRRAVQVYAVTAEQAEPLRQQQDSPVDDTDPLPRPPCTGCDASGAVTITPR